MRYRDVWDDNPSYWHGDYPQFGHHEPEQKCLAWTANYEHAVFDLDDEVHEATRWLWFKPAGTGFILCYELMWHFHSLAPDGSWIYHEWNAPRWVFVELKIGDIPLKNNNPFAPLEIMACNSAESKFPQNMGVSDVD